MKFSIRLLYLYLFSFIGLLTTVIGTVQLVDLVIKVYVFKGADEYTYIAPVKINPEGTEMKPSEQEAAMQRESQNKETTRQRQRQASAAIAMIVVGFPLYKYHWKSIQKEGKKN